MQEKRAEEALAALKRHRDELRESVDLLARRVAVYRRKADAAANDLRSSESQLAALGRQADACVGMLTMDGSGDGGQPASPLPAGFLDPSRCDACAASLHRDCFAVIDDFLPRDVAEALSAEMRAAHDASVARGDLPTPHAAAAGAAGQAGPSDGEAKAGAVVADAVDLSEVALSVSSEAKVDSISAQKPEAALEQEPLRFQLGRLGGGATGSGLRYAHPRVRGDHFTWLRPREPTVPHLETAFAHLDALALRALPDRVPGLRGRFLARGMAMAAFYPGDGARYVRHCDNPHGNGRILTLLLYLTPQWSAGDGGELRLYPDPHAPPSSAHSTLLQRRGSERSSAAVAPGAAGESRSEDKPAVTIEPFLNRAALFWSDSRVPHEVLPTVRPRWAVTVWYVDVLEVAGAQTAGAADEDTDRVCAEIAKFEQAYGSVHTLEQ